MPVFLIWICSILLYIVGSLTIGIGTYFYLKERGSREVETTAVFYGAIWPLTMWIIIGGLIIRKIERKQNKPRREINY